VRLRPHDRHPQRRIPRAEGLDEGVEVVGAGWDGGEVVGEEAGVGEGVEERLEDEVDGWGHTPRTGREKTVLKRIECGDEVYEGHSAAGEGFAQPLRRPELVASGGVERAAGRTARLGSARRGQQ
jgi:hypothetical protein